MDKVKLQREENYILVESNKEAKLSEFEKTIEEILTLGVKHEIKKVLVDSRDREYQPTVQDLMAGGEVLAKKTRGKMQFAILVKDTSDNNLFFENVCVNRGANICFFNDLEKARKWLALKSV